MRGPTTKPTYRPAGPTVLFSSRLFGLREWSLGFSERGELRLGGFGDKEWRRDGETTWAVCHATRPGVASRHASPSPAGNCTCGLYAHHPWALIPNAWETTFSPPHFPASVVGIVEAWGRVHVHGEGFRAQYARPRALAAIGCPLDSDFGRLVSGLAEAHKAEALELSSGGDLIEHCRNRGLGLARTTVASLLGGG